MYQEDHGTENKEGEAAMTGRKGDRDVKQQEPDSSEGGQRSLKTGAVKASEIEDKGKGEAVDTKDEVSETERKKMNDKDEEVETENKYVKGDEEGVDITNEKAQVQKETALAEDGAMEGESEVANVEDGVMEAEYQTSQVKGTTKYIHDGLEKPESKAMKVQHETKETQCEEVDVKEKAVQEKAGKEDEKAWKTEDDVGVPNPEGE